MEPASAGFDYPTVPRQGVVIVSVVDTGGGWVAPIVIVLVRVRGGKSLLFSPGVAVAVSITISSCLLAG